MQKALNLFRQPETTSITIVVGKEKIYIETDIEIDVAVQKEKLVKDLELS